MRVNPQGIHTTLPNTAGGSDPGDGLSFSNIASRIGQATEGGRSETVFYLNLQRQIQAESRFYQTVSNILKARHESSMAAIRNLK